MAGLSELLGKLDTDNQVRGRQFERICKWYLQNDPKYRLQLNRVWLWSEWPGRWGADAGIDLVAQTHDKALWAVQAKACAPTHHTTKADLDTFLSESSRESFSYRLLISTSNFIGSTAERTLHAQEKPVGTVLLSDLEKSQLVWPDSPDKLEAKPLEPKKPLRHQQKAVLDVCNGFLEKDRGQLIMACGTGKTLTALWIAEELQGQRVLILVPTLTLLAQTLREWTQNTCHSFHYLPVCSDDTVRGADRLIARTSDLGLPVTTDPREVVDFLLKPGRRVVFSTYQSSPVIAKAFNNDNVPPFDIAIADEAHRCAGPSLASFATILDSAAIRANHRLFMTATPRYFTDRLRKEAKVVDFEIASMDDERKFGPVFHRLSFSEAIEQDLLSDYQVVIVGVDDPTYREYAEKGAFVIFDGKNSADARTLASHIAVAKAMRKYDLRRVISFHNRVKRAEDFSSELPDVIRWMASDLRPSGDVWSKHVSGEMPSGKRDALLGRFQHLEEGERGLLANARCLAEGIDLPNLDGVAFIDPRGSQVDVVQAVGRAIRKAPDKKIGTVVLPVFVDTQQDSEAALNSSVFKPIWSVLRALRAHDEVLAEELDRLRRQVGRYEKKDLALPGKLIIDLPVSISAPFAEAFRLRMVERSTSSWEFWFGLLENYVEIYGNALVRSDYVTKNGLRLGSWIIMQRQMYQKGRLLFRRQRDLEELPGWIWNTVEASWRESFGLLCRYVRRYGDALVPQGYKTEDGFCLGSWVSAQRLKYRKTRLSHEKQQVLERLPGWTWEPYGDQWQEGFRHLSQYVKNRGNALVAAKYKSADGFALGRWVRKRRWDYTERKLSLDRQEALQALPGWTWDVLSDMWVEGIAHLRDYVQRKGSALVPSKHVADDGYALGYWVVKQRMDYKRRKLSLKQQKALEELPSWVWDKEDAVWTECVASLHDFATREGHTLVPRGYFTESGHNLGMWVTSRRYDFKLGRLSLKKRKAIEGIPAWVWDTLDAAWKRGYESLLDYVRRQGSLVIPAGYVTTQGYKLASWVTRQRSEYRRGKLSQDRVTALEQVEGWTWEPNEARWQEGLAYLRDYVKRIGNARVPPKYETESGFRLGHWVHANRQMYRMGTLPVQHQVVLEQFPRWSWGPHKELWQKGLEHLRAYLGRVGHATVTKRYVTADGFALGRWIALQREAYTCGMLSSAKQKALQELPGWTWTPQRIARNEQESPPSAAGQ